MCGFAAREIILGSLLDNIRVSVHLCVYMLQCRVDHFKGPRYDSFGGPILTEIML